MTYVYSLFPYLQNASEFLRGLIITFFKANFSILEIGFFKKSDFLTLAFKIFKKNPLSIFR